MQQLQNIIETAFERRAEITPANADTVTREAVNQVIALLDSGALRVAEKIDGQWVTHQWLKKAVLLSFRINDNQVIEGAESRYFDKVPTTTKRVFRKKASALCHQRRYVRVHLLPVTPC